MTCAYVLSSYTLEPVLQARQDGKTRVRASLDLGLTKTEVCLEADRIAFPDGQGIPWELAVEILSQDQSCYLLEDHVAAKIQVFSDALDRFYSLMSTERAPTLLISGIPMHRVKGITPDRDTLNKTRTLSPMAGRVLDTCTGLGYTAIEAAKTAEQVLTIELDPEILKIARLNPWSRLLFDNPAIHQAIGDAYDLVPDFDDASFSRIVHDPPTFSLAGHLYSGVFYQQLFRILERRGRLFHYIGDLQSRSGRNVVRGVVKRLQEAGFSRIVRKQNAFGVVAYK